MSSKLYVGNLSYSIGDQELRNAFEQFGEVQSAVVIMDRDTGRSRGFGFVEYEAASDAERAISELNGTDLGGRNLIVNAAREDRSRGPRGGGGGHRGGRGGHGGHGGGGGRR